MTVPSQGTFVAGDVLTAAELNSDVRDAVNFLINKPMVKVYGSADWMNWASGGTLYLTTWNSESYDTDSMHSTASNTGRINFPTAGVYRISGHLRISQPGSVWATNSRIPYEFRLNAGATVIYDPLGNLPAAQVKGSVQFTFDYKFAAADYIELWAGFTAGGSSVTSLNPALESGIDNTILTAEWIGVGT